MDIDKLKSMFTVNANENLDKSRKLLDQIEKTFATEDHTEQIDSLFILAHSIRSMSVFLPIYRITLLSKDMESKIKLWQEVSYHLTIDDLNLVRVEIDSLHNMIENLEDYFDE